MQYENWDFENDMVVTDRKNPYSDGSHAIPSGGAYIVETEVGTFYQKMRPDGSFDLVHRMQGMEQVCLENIVVVTSNLKKTCIIVYCGDTGENILIDTRGVFYLLEIKKERLMPNPCSYGMTLDRKSGYYHIGGPSREPRWMIRAVNKQRQLMVMIESAPTGTGVLNPDFKKLFGKRKTGAYRYLTVMNSKKGKLLEYLMAHGLPCEVLPNVLEGDKTKNIRIPINEETMQLEAVNFIMAKYGDTYAIKGFPIATLIGTAEISIKSGKHPMLRYAKATDAQYTKVMALINDLKILYEAKTDMELYKKLFKKILGLFPDPDSLPYENRFTKLLLPYPGGDYLFSDAQARVIDENISYINALMPELRIKSSADIEPERRAVVYRKIYDLAKKNYQSQMNAYEAEILSRV